eukprot:5010533-Prymnesium_polylepis.1
MEEWAPAAAACKFALDATPTHPKALFRLAKAHEGAGNLQTAVSTLGDLLTVEGQAGNREARALLERLRGQVQEEKQTFGGLFDKNR